MSLENKKLLFKALWQFMVKESSSVKRELTPLHHSHTPPCFGLEILLHDVMWFSMFPCFMVYCLTCNQHSNFPVPAHRHRNFLFYFWPHPCLGPVKEFWVEFAFISFYSCCFHLCTFASAHKLLAALQLFLSSALLIISCLNLESQLCVLHLENSLPL